MLHAGPMVRPAMASSLFFCIRSVSICRLASRPFTTPSMQTTHSARIFSISAKAGLSLSVALMFSGSLLIAVTPGYEGNPEANVKNFFEAEGKRWFRTGDQGAFDDDGFLSLTGRLKEIINRGGEKISPLEVDGTLSEHPAIAQGVTFAMPHDKLGEEVAAAYAEDFALDPIANRDGWVRISGRRR